MPKVRIAVIGAGLMGHGIAQVFGLAGHNVAITDSHAPTLASARERLRLAAYIALTWASPAEESAAIEKPTLVNALAIVTKPQSQKRRDFI